jgi:hypothetical protein
MELIFAKPMIKSIAYYSSNNITKLQSLYDQVTAAGRQQWTTASVFRLIRIVAELPGKSPS